MAWLFFGTGMALLLLGSGALARGGATIGRMFRLSPLLISLLAGAFAMSSPELAVVLRAGGQAPDIVLGTVVGGALLNILLVLGLAALFRPVPTPPKVVFRDGLVLFAASAALAAAALAGGLSRVEGAALLCSLLLYLALCVGTERGRTAPLRMASAHAIAHADMQHGRSLGLNLVLLFLGVACLVFGAHYAVDGAIAIARESRLPIGLVAMTVVAMGAALPEIGAALGWAGQGGNPLLGGQLIGSSIFNILLVLGLAAVLHPLAITPAFARLAVLPLAAASLFLIPVMLTGWRVRRFEGALLVALYLGYLGYYVSQQGLLPFIR